MTHSYLSGGLPTAIITRKRNEMRSYSRNNDSVIYLNDKDTFEIRLFNPLQTKVGVEIRINGQTTSDSMLVLNPGQDVTLERYLDSKRKFMFETYHIDGNNPSAKKAIENNGLVEIFFHNEKFIPTSYTIYTCGDTSRGYGTTNHCLYSSTVDFNGTLTFDDTSANVGLGSTPNQNLKGMGKSKRKRVKAKMEETGTIGKGDKSNQKLEQVNIEFESYSFHNLQFKLMPASQRDRIDSSESSRNYCPSCGYRLRKSSWEFCPKCGSKI